MRKTLTFFAMIGLLVSGSWTNQAAAQGDYGENPIPDSTATTPPTSTEPAPASAAEPAPAPAPSGASSVSSTPPSHDAGSSEAKTNGIWLEAKLRTGMNIALTGGYSSMSTYNLPGLLVGYKADKMVLALGINLFLTNWEDRNEGADHNQTAVGGIVGPVVQFELASKGPLSLYGQGGLGFKFVHSKEKYGDLDAKYGSYGFSINVAGGARYFLHNSFALGVELGIDLDSTWANDGEGDKDRVLQMVLYGALTAAVLW